MYLYDSYHFPLVYTIYFRYALIINSGGRPEDLMTTTELREAAKKAARGYLDSERELCDLLSAIDQCKLWRTWGYSSLVHYAEDELGLTHRKALELVRVNSSLEALPQMKKAFREEGVPFSKVREATRVATPGSDADWARKLKERPYREIEREVFSGRRATTITLRLDMTAEQYERFERCVEAVRRRRGRGTGLDECVDLMATTFLSVETGGDRSSTFPRGVAGAAFTQVIYRCEDCDRARVQTRKGLAEVSNEVLDQAACDSVVLREGQRARRAIPREVVRAVWLRAESRCERCSQRGWLHLHHRVPVSEDGRHSKENLLLLCSACHRAAHQEGQPDSGHGRDRGRPESGSKARSARGGRAVPDSRSAPGAPSAAASRPASDGRPTPASRPESDGCPTPASQPASRARPATASQPTPAGRPNSDRQRAPGAPSGASRRLSEPRSGWGASGRESYPRGYRIPNGPRPGWGASGRESYPRGYGLPNGPRSGWGASERQSNPRGYRIPNGPRVCGRARAPVDAHPGGSGSHGGLRRCDGVRVPRSADSHGQRLPDEPGRTGGTGDSGHDWRADRRPVRAHTALAGTRAPERR
jgi:hypothetical protein